jgi:aspartyl aminopeptidase
MRMNRTNNYYSGVRNFGSLYGTKVIYGGNVLNSYYEEQRFGINGDDRPSLIRRNLHAIKRMALDAKPLDAILTKSKIVSSRNRTADHEDNLNRTHEHEDFGAINKKIEVKKGTNQAYFTNILFILSQKVVYPKNGSIPQSVFQIYVLNSL